MKKKIVVITIAAVLVLAISISAYVMTRSSNTADTPESKTGGQAYSTSDPESSPYNPPRFETHTLKIMCFTKERGLILNQDNMIVVYQGTPVCIEAPWCRGYAPVEQEIWWEPDDGDTVIFYYE